MSLFNYYNNQLTGWKDKDYIGCPLSPQNVQQYQMLSAGAEPVESQLHANLVEYLNAEIVLRTVTDITQAVHWLKSTFFAVRVRQGYPPGSVDLNTVMIHCGGWYMPTHAQLIWFWWWEHFSTVMMPVRSSCLVDVSCRISHCVLRWKLGVLKRALNNNAFWGSSSSTRASFFAELWSQKLCKCISRRYWLSFYPEY